MAAGICRLATPCHIPGIWEGQTDKTPAGGRYVVRGFEVHVEGLLVYATAHWGLFAVGRGGLLIQACAPWVLGSLGWSGGAATVGARRRSGASPATTAPNGPAPARPWTRPRRRTGGCRRRKAPVTA